MINTQYNIINGLLEEIYRFERTIVEMYLFLLDLYPDKVTDLPDVDDLFPRYRDIDLPVNMV